jgi:mannose-6-phosphate isomerase-like protein (cupin superfamily)
MQYRNVNDVPWPLGDAGAKYVMCGPHVEWGLFRMRPGQSSKDYGRHIHRVVEETFYFLEGSPRFVINGVEHRVRPGDAFRIEPGEPHDLINDTEQDCTVVFIKYPYLPDDKILA